MGIFKLFENSHNLLSACVHREQEIPFRVTSPARLFLSARAHHGHLWPHYSLADARTVILHSTQTFNIKIFSSEVYRLFSKYVLLHLAA